MQNAQILKINRRNFYTVYYIFIFEVQQYNINASDKHLHD